MKRNWIPIIVLAAMLVIVGAAIGSTLDSKKIDLDRDNIYYDIKNDAGDGGNFIFTFHVPQRTQQGVLTGKTSYCIVYKDHTKDGTMGGMDCTDPK